MAVDKEMSYEYQNEVRDLSDAFTLVVQKNPILASLVGSPLIGLDGQPLFATNRKHEWLEDVVSPQSWTVNGTRAIGGAALTLVSTSGLKTGMVLAFEGANGASKTVQLIVTAVTNTTTAAVAVYSDGTDVELVATDVVKLVAHPKGESTEADATDGYEPTTAYNNTQIFDRTAQVSETAEVVKKYGIASALSYQVERKLWELTYEIANSVIYGRRVTRDASHAGSMGGILYFLEKALGNKVDASGADLSPTLLNDAFELGYGNGADNMTAILCSPVQARKISAFNVAGNNPIIMRDEKTAGSYVQQFVGDLPVGNGGMISRVIVEQNFPKDKVALLDLSKIGIMPLTDRQFKDKDATPNGADYMARRVIGEYTMEFKNAATNHVLLTGLKL